MMMKCDTLLMVGTTFPYSEFLPKPGQARGVQIDHDGRMLSIRYPCEVNLQGDSRLTLKALLPMLEYKKDRSFQNMLVEDMNEWWHVLEGGRRTQPTASIRSGFSMSFRLAFPTT